VVHWGGAGRKYWENIGEEQMACIKTQIMALVRREEAKEMRSIEHGTVSKRRKPGMRNDKTPFPTASNQSNMPLLLIIHT